MTPTVGDYIKAYVSAFRARRGRKLVHAGGRAMQVRTPAERVIYLPNGHHVKVSVDDSGVATQVEEDEALHAIVRPATIRRRLVTLEGVAAAAAATSPRPIHAKATPRNGGTHVPRR